MVRENVIKYIEELLQQVPSDWLRLTTHRLDIYNEELAKIEFLQQLEALYDQRVADSFELSQLPTAYDYIRLGHPLSCVLEWMIAKLNKLAPENVISFASRTIGILAILRKNAIANRNTRIVYHGSLPVNINFDILKKVYGYNFELTKIEDIEELADYNGSTILLSQHGDVSTVASGARVDFIINIHPDLGSIVILQSHASRDYISDIQHVRRRETIAMSPADCYKALELLVGLSPVEDDKETAPSNRTIVITAIKGITNSTTEALLSNSGLSIQYAIMMGLIHDAQLHHKGKQIKIMVPPNCYGGTNDQARRVAASISNVEVVDLPVDDGRDMVRSIDEVLGSVASQDAVPYIIAEIPTNPRVEVPDLDLLRVVLTKKRYTTDGHQAIDPVFILDQTFCPNVQFLGSDAVLEQVRTIAYVSGSKFPSGGLCTAGYCVGNDRSASLMTTISTHLSLCNNEATDDQVNTLAQQMPSMTTRINEAYKNTRELVDFISDILPDAKINFVSQELADQGFTPSVFSLDLPSKGNTAEEREAHKRRLNYELINLMISEIPEEAKFCVSYGQLHGSYWTIPATSTQGTTKEGDKDYIVRVSIAPVINVAKHKRVFLKFVERMTAS